MSGNLVRYVPGDTEGNAILRLALLETWRRCYWCRAPRDFAEVDIDHIIPRTLSGDALSQILHAHVIPASRRQGFDLHALYNLAPICKPCNTEKSNSNLAESGLVTARLEKARKLCPRVERAVRSFRSSNVVTKAVLAVSMADLSDSGSKRALLQFGPLVVHRLGLLAPALLTQYSSIHELDDPKADRGKRVIITLEESSRRARVVLEDVFGQDFNEALVIPVKALEAAIMQGLQSDITERYEQRGHISPVVGPPAGRMSIEIDDLTYDSAEDIFEIHGDFDVDMSSHVGIVGNDGSTEYRQADAQAHAQFSVQFWQDDAGSGTFQSEDATLIGWQDGPAPW